jgi:hypothetical protein
MQNPRPFHFDIQRQNPLFPNFFCTFFRAVIPRKICRIQHKTRRRMKLSTGTCGEHSFFPQDFVPPGCKTAWVMHKNDGIGMLAILANLWYDTKGCEWT